MVCEATNLLTNPLEAPSVLMTPISPLRSFVAREATVATRAMDPTQTSPPENVKMDNRPEYCKEAAFASESRVYALTPATSELTAAASVIGLIPSPNLTKTALTCPGLNWSGDIPNVDGSPPVCCHASILFAVSMEMNITWSMNVPVLGKMDCLASWTP